MSKKDSTKAESGNDSANGRQQRLTELTTRLNEVFKQASSLGEKDPTKKSMLVRVDDLENRVEFWQQLILLQALLPGLLEIPLPRTC